MLTGIAGPARWLDRYLAPVVTSRLGRCLPLLTVVAGAGCLVAGPPGRLSGTSPATQVLLLLALGLLTSLIHEFAHAVVLVHYGRTPRYAGFGLYWGAVSFYVDSTPALTLPRRQRVVQALAGLLHRRRPPSGIGLAAYGAVSLLAGFALIAVSVAIQWQVLGGLITALVTGSVTDILIGCYLVVPLAIAVLASLAGLIAQTVAAPPESRA